MTGDSPAAPAESGGVWGPVLRWPLKGGMLGAVILLTALAYLSVRNEGGYSPSEQDQRAMVRGVVLLVSVATLGHAAWRAISCTYPQERPVPWGADDGDDTPLPRKLFLFTAVLFVTFLPVVVWVSIRGFLEAKSWVNWLVIAAACAWAATQLPLALAGTVVRGSALAALPGAVAKLRRAAPYPAKVAGTTSLAFVGAFVLSLWLSETFVQHPTNVGLPSDHPRGPPDMVGPWLSAGLLVLRAAGFYAAVVSFRVAGLLVVGSPGTELEFAL